MLSFEPLIATIYRPGISFSEQLICWLFGLLLTAVLVGKVKQRASLDIPSDRSMHRVPTPRGGGLGIVIAFAICGLILTFLGVAESLVYPLLIGGLPIAAIGWKDDKGHVSPKVRALVHLVSCFAAILTHGLLIEGISFIQDAQSLVWLAIESILAAYFLNLFNFMDGLDGFAGSEAAFVGFSIAGLSTILTQDQVWFYSMFGAPPESDVSPRGALAGLIGACCLGFLVWNWPPAKIFLGDVGSGFLGFALAFLAISEARSYVWVWVILLGVFIVDGTYTLAVRFLTKQEWHKAHSLHTYQKLAKRCGHRTVTVSVIAINIFWLLPLAWYVRVHPEHGPIATAIAYTPLIFIAWRYRAGLPESSPNAASSMAQ